MREIHVRMRIFRLNKSMRIDHIFQQLLLEHNVVNRDDIVRYLAPFSARVRDPLLRKWFDAKLPKYLEQHEDYNQQVEDPSQLQNPPKWLPAAIERGDDIRTFVPHPALAGEVEHLTDFLNALPEIEPVFAADGNRLKAMTVPQAKQKADEWVQASAKKAGQAGPGEYEVLMKFDGGFYAMTTTDLETVHRDGAILQNCLGQGYYDADISDKSMAIVFIRDSKHEPHVAISAYGDRQLREVKGKNNKPPVEKYAKMAIEYLNASGFSTENRDVEAMGYAVKDGKYMSLADTAELVRSAGEFTIKYIESLREYWCQIGGDTRLKLRKRSQNTLTYQAESMEGPNAEFSRFLCDWANDTGIRGHSNFQCEHLPYDASVGKFGLPEDISRKLAESNGVSLYYIEQPKGDGEEPMKNFVWRKDFGTLCSAVEMKYFSHGLHILQRDHRATLPDEVFEVAAALPEEYAILSRSDGGFQEERNYPVTWYRGESRFGYINQIGEQLYSKDGVEVYKWRALKLATILGIFVDGKQVERVKQTDKNKWDVDHRGVTQYPLGDLMLANKTLAGVFLNTLRNVEAWGLAFAEDGTVGRAKDIERDFHIFEDGSKFTFYALQPDEEGEGKRKTRMGVLNYYEGGKRCFTARFDGRNMGAEDGFVKKAPNPHHMAWFCNKYNVKDDTVLALGLSHEYNGEHRPMVECNEYLKSDDYQVYRLGRRMYTLDSEGVFLGHFVISDNRVSSLSLPYSDNKPFYPVLAQVSEKFGVGASFSSEDDGSRFSYNYKVELEMYKQGVTAYAEDGFGVVPFVMVEDVWPEKKIARIGTGDDALVWVKRALELGDNFPNGGHREPRNHAYSLVNKEGETIYRALFKARGDELFIESTNLTDDETIHAAMGVLMSKIKATCALHHLIEMGLYRLKSGNYKVAKGTPLEPFFMGYMRFNDGLNFRRMTGYSDSKYEWHLEDEGRETVAKLAITDDGVDKIELRRGAQVNPAMISKHVNEMMKVISKVMGY